MTELPPPVLDTEAATPFYVVGEEDSTPPASLLDKRVADNQEHTAVEGNGTTCFVYYRPFFERHQSWSDTGRLIRDETTTEPSAAADEPVTDKVTQTRDKRLVLLARKYASQEFSAEETARLEIVTARLRKMVPRVEAADFELLEQIADDADAAKDRQAAVRRKLDLDR
ncbi:MAG: hypothetical protein R6V85_20570 [Polyangia bacterium]